jgi:hypothetical protein
MRPVNELVAATPDEDVRRFIFYGGKALPKLGDGRIMLLGDAAHAMTNTLGQGSGMAFEDSIVLARALSSGLDPVEGLRAYEERRMARTDAALELIMLASTSAEETRERCGSAITSRSGRLPPAGAAYERWLADVDRKALRQALVRSLMARTGEDEEKFVPPREPGHERGRRSARVLPTLERQRAQSDGPAHRLPQHELRCDRLDLVAEEPLIAWRSASSTSEAGRARPDPADVAFSGPARSSAIRIADSSPRPRDRSCPR